MGLDISWRSRKDLGTNLKITDTLCEAGRFARRSAPLLKKLAAEGKTFASVTVTSKAQRLPSLSSD